MIELVARFESCTLRPEDFHHEQHVEVVWHYLQEMPLGEAILRFSRMLKQFAASLGKTTLYHETITWAYVILTHERMQRGSRGTWAEFSRDNADLLTWTPSILHRYYSAEVLGSELARSTFILPGPRATYEELR